MSSLVVMVLVIANKSAFQIARKEGGQFVEKIIKLILIGADWIVQINNLPTEENAEINKFVNAPRYINQFVGLIINNILPLVNWTAKNKKTQTWKLRILVCVLINPDLVFVD